MENPRRHDKKNTTKTLPLNIVAGAGAGRFGIGGVVLFGGVLVTATVVSALAFRRRSQRRSSPENMESTPAPVPAPVTEMKSDGGLNKLELMMKSDEDSSAESLPLEVQNLSSDEVVSMKEVKSENIQSLIPDGKHNYEEKMDLNVGEDQENTLIRVDYAFESEEFDNNCEKIDQHSEEQVVMEARIGEDSCLERDDGDGNEEQKKHLMLIDDENDAHVDANSSVCDEGVISIEEHEAVEVPVKDVVSEASQNEDEEDEDHKETMFMNKAAAKVEVKGNLQMQVLEEIEMKGDDERDYADQIGHEVVMEEEKAIDAASLLEIEVTGEDEVIKEACVNLVNKEGVFETTDHEAAPDAQEMHQVYETFVVECVMNRLMEAVDDQTTAKEDVPPSGLMNKDELFNKDEKRDVDEMVHDQSIEAAKVDCQTDNSPMQLMITEDELVKKDEIPHDDTVKEDEKSEEVVIKEVIKMTDHEVAPEVHQVCETFVAAGVMNRLKEADNDQTTAKDDITAEEKDTETTQNVEEQATIEEELFNEDEKRNVDEMIHDQMIEAAKVGDQTGYELVKKDEIFQHVESVKEDELKDSCMHEELTAEAKISGHKTEEHIEENKKVKILRENQNDNNDNGNIKEDNGSKSASTKEEKHAFAAGPWDLKLMALFVVISVWCLCHWYSELPFAELSLVGSLFFIFIILGYRNRATYLVKYEGK